jgi:hypothetical protein
VTAGTKAAGVGKSTIARDRGGPTFRHAPRGRRLRSLCEQSLPGGSSQLPDITDFVKRRREKTFTTLLAERHQV